MESQRDYESKGVMDRITEGSVCGADAERPGQGRPKEAPPIILIGVQHTGTKFFVELLEQHYGPYTNLKTPIGDFYYDHPYPHKIPLIQERMKGRLLITTLRDRQDTKASWVRRGMHTMEAFEAQWDAWEEHILPRALVVSIDDRKEERLAKLSEALGIEFKTDWHLVNATRRRGIGR